MNRNTTASEHSTPLWHWKTHLKSRKHPPWRRLPLLPSEPGGVASIRMVLGYRTMFNNTKLGCCVSRVYQQIKGKKTYYTKNIIKMLDKLNTK
jgi:hypothetical protein